VDLNLIAQNVAAVASSISGVRGASPWEVDTIPATPYAVVGMSRAQIIPGDRQVTNMTMPLRLYVERIADSARDAKTTNTYVATFVTTFAKDQSLAAAVTDSYIAAWDSDVFYAIGGALYAAVDFTLSVTVHEHVVQALRTVI
jgi:hypothetical protein